MSDESPKIIIDEDWKSQVAKEKQLGDQPAGDQIVGDQAAVSATDSAADDALSSPPPASIESLVSMLFSQTLAALGQFPMGDGEEMKINKPLAKYFIDTLELLGNKTNGNLSEEETKLISDTLHGLRMAYVSIKAN